MIHQEYKKAAEKPMQSTAIMPIINRLKITLGILLTATMIFSLTACGGGSSDPENTSAGNNTTTEAGISTERYDTMEDATIEIYDPYIEIRPGADIPEEPSSQPANDGILHLTDVFKTMEYGLSLEQAYEKYGEPYYSEVDEEYTCLYYPTEFLGVNGTMEMEFEDDSFEDIYWERFNTEDYLKYYDYIECESTPDDNKEYEKAYILEDIRHLEENQEEADRLFTEIIGSPGITTKGTLHEVDNNKSWFVKDNIAKVENGELEYTEEIKLYNWGGNNQFDQYYISFWYIDSDSYDDIINSFTANDVNYYLE